MFRLFGTVAAALLFAGAAQANTVVGSIYIFPNDTVPGNAVPGSVPVGPADVTFSVNSPIDFDSRGILGDATNYTIGQFLGTGSAFNITANTPGALTHTVNDTLFNFTGTVTVTNGQTFSVTHDDGLSLIIDGITVIADGGPTAPTGTTETYTGPTGNFNFQLVYGECCGAPAVLAIDLPFVSQTGSVPEPSTWAMMILGFFGVGFMAYRRQNKQNNKMGFRMA
jgi:hypothetical protein